MKATKKVLFSVILSIMMIVTFIPCTALAAGPEAADPAGEQPVVEEGAGTDQDVVVEENDAVQEEETLDAQGVEESNDLAFADIYGVVDQYYHSGRVYQPWVWKDDGRPEQDMPLKDVHVYLGATKLIQNKDYKVTYAYNYGLRDYNNPALIIFTGIGKYEGAQKVAFQIVKQSQHADVNLTAKSVYANKSDSVIKMRITKYPVISGANQGATSIKYDKNYITVGKGVKSTDNTGDAPINTYTYKITGKKAGSTKLTVKFAGNSYYKPVTKTYTIKVVARPKIIDSSISLSKYSYTYNAKAKKPSVTVVVKGKTLKKNTHYTVKYKNNVNAGTATVVVTAKGGFYQGTASKTFRIYKAAQNINMKVTPGKTLNKHGANGKMTQLFTNWNDCKGTFTYKSSNTNVIRVTRDSHHNCTVEPREAGTATVTVTAAATKNFKKATKTYKFTVQDVQLKPITADMIDVNCISHEKHDVTVFKNKADRDAFVKSDRNKNTTLYKSRLVYGKDWTNTIVNNSDGTTTVTVVGIGNYWKSVKLIVRP